LVGGVPALLLYVFAAWALIVVLLALVARGGPDGEDPP
jgi:hypothetical protein